MMQTAFDTLLITSAGGDSPKQNRVIDVEIPAVDFQGILDDSIRELINDAIDEREIAGGGGVTARGKQTPGAQGQAQEALQLITGGIGSTPQSLVSRLVPLLGPAMLIFMLPEIFKFIVGELIKPGGPFDVRFKREMLKEQFGFYDRQTQWDSSHGYRNVIIQGVNGFKAEQGSFHASMFRDIKEQGGTNVQSARIGLTDKAFGFQGR